MVITKDTTGSPISKNSTKQFKNSDEEDHTDDDGTIHIQGKNYESNTKDCLSVTAIIAKMKQATKSQFS